MSLYSPLWSENHAIDFPSGDHTGFRSATPGDRVRLRQSPFSTGMVNTSPRASNKARAPVGRERRIGQTLAHVRPVGQSPGQVAPHIDDELLVGLGRGIEQVDVSALFVDQDIATRVQMLGVEILVVGELGDLLGAGIIGVEVGCVVPVGEEIDRVAQPDRIGVVAPLPRQLGHGKVGQVHHPDRLSLATAGSSATLHPRGSPPGR